MDREAAYQSQDVIMQSIVVALKSCYDPEIPVDIFELGLIYDIEVDDNKAASIRMTLTSPLCPVAETLPGDVQARVRAAEGVEDASIDLVWDPPWDPSMMSEAAKLQLGF